MNMIKRVQRLINANINDMLDRVESPETMANQLVRELDEGIIEVRRNTAAAMARAKLTRQRAERLEATADKWKHEAETALRHDREDLARQALVKSRETGIERSALSGQLDQEEALVANLRTELRALENKVQEVRRKRDTLVSRRRITESRTKLLEHAEQADRVFDRAISEGDAIIAGFTEFTRWEEQVDRKLAEAEAREELRRERTETDLHRELEDLGQAEDVETELKTIRERLTKEV